VHALEDIPVTVFTRFHSQNQYHISCIFAIKQIHIPTPTIVVLTMKMCLLLWLLLALVGSLPLVSSYRPAQPSFRLSTSEERQTEMAEANMGLDDVSNTQEAAALQNYLLRNKKQTRFLEKGSISLVSVLFPGVSPREYKVGEDISIYAGLVESLASLIIFQQDDLPEVACQTEPELHTNQCSDARWKEDQLDARSHPEVVPSSALPG
jgi:hypothetical protein